MEEEMEIEPFFVVEEIDINYEFDASRFFDFTREESLIEANEAELWFSTAQSYPPSPFVSKLMLMENVNTSPKSKVVENNTTALLDNHSDNGVVHEFQSIDGYNRDCEGVDRGIFTNLQSGNLQKVLNQPMEMTTAPPLFSNSGMRFNSHISTGKLKAKVKSAVKPIPRSSTLMKPTASQLAKQNRLPQVAGSRFQTLLAQNERSLCNSSALESQASKRQKLEGGHLRKVTDGKQQIDLIHKVPKKDGTIDRNSVHAKLKLTIPREPDLETAHRAQRIRPMNSTEPEHVPPAARRFKARPLNRKILEAPSLPLPKKSTPRLPEFQEFHLKTLQRAMQHTSAVSTSSFHCNDSDKGLDKPSSISVSENGNRESKRPNIVDASKQDGCGIMHNFKARPLNKKIFSSRGDIGVFRNIKRETTVPMEFNFHTEKRIQHNLPIELFSKLSLTSELQPNNGSQLKLPHSSCISTKGLKENRSNSLQPGHEITHMVKEKPPMFGGKQIQCGSDGCATEVGNQLSKRRSLGIR